MANEASLVGTCCYYAYVDFGPAMVNGNLDVRENVYRSSGLRKFIRYPDNDARNFTAYYTSYHNTKSGNFEITNIGPYDTEEVAYDALNQIVLELKQAGYKPKTSAHDGDLIRIKMRQMLNLPKITGSCLLTLILFVIGLASGPARADYVVTDDESLGAQAYIESPSIPAQWVKERNSEGKTITSVSFRNGKWTIVMSANSGFSRQSYIVADAIPYGWMNEKRLDKYFVTSVASSPKQLMIVMSRGAGFTNQELPNRTMFVVPGSSEGYRVTALGKREGKLLSVESTGTNITDQAGALRSEFPRDFIVDSWDKGFRITSLFFLDGWYVIVSQTSDRVWGERCITSQNIETELKKGGKIKLSY